MIIGGLAAGYSIIFVAVTAILRNPGRSACTAAGISWPTPDPARPRPRKGNGQGDFVVEPLGHRRGPPGVIIGAIFSTGPQLPGSPRPPLSTTDGRLWLLLALAGLMAIILGMGITASAVYIHHGGDRRADLREAGVPEMAAHMFALYFGNRLEHQPRRSRWRPLRPRRSPAPIR